MLQLLNNVRLKFSGQPPRRHDAEDRNEIPPKLERQDKMTFGGVRTALKGIWKQRGRDPKPGITLETDEEDFLLGNKVEANLAEVFGKGWATHPMKERLRAEIYPRLLAVYNRQVGNK